MFWPWTTSTVPGTQQERVQRVQEFRQQISDDTQMVSQLRTGGRNPDCEEFANRWLVSRSWDVSSAVLGVAKHCEWLSAQAGIVPVTDGDIPRALSDSNDELFLQGCDESGLPVMICNLAAHQPSQDKNDRRHALIWCMEHLVTLADRRFQTSGGQAIIIFDLQGYTMDNVDTEDAAAIVDILQKQYPERLGQLFIYEAPTVFWALWNMIWPFLTASTRDKVQLVSGEEGLKDIHAMVPPHILPSALSGTAPLKPFADAITSLAVSEKASHTRRASNTDSAHSDSTDL